MHTAVSRQKSMFVWFALTFLLMFGPKFGAFLDIINVVSIFVLVWSMVKRGVFTKPDSTFLLIIIYAVYSNYILLVNGVYDQWHYFQPWRAAINYLAITTLVVRMAAYGLRWRHVLSLVNLSIYLHSVIIIVTFLLPDFRHAFFELTGFIEKSYLRSPGLTHSYGITSLVTVIPFLLAPYTKGSLYSSKYDYIGLAIVFISLFLLARVGLYLLPIIAIAVISRASIAGSLRISQLFGAVAGVAAIVTLFWLSNQTIIIENSVGSAGFYQGISIFINESVRHSLEIFYSVLNGDVSVKSFSTIGEFIFHNKSTIEYVFGTGYYGRGDDFTHLETDISYAHFFSMVGVLGLVLLILSHTYPLINYTAAPQLLRFIFYILITIIIVTNYKEATYFTRNLYSLWCFVAACLYTEARGRLYNLSKFKE